MSVMEFRRRHISLMDAMNDWDLLEQYRTARSRQAFETLVAQHAGLVYATCRRRLRDAHLAEDAAQTVFMVLARRPPKRHSSGPLAGWIYQTAVYTCNNMNRSREIRDQHERKAAEQAQHESSQLAGGLSG